MEGRFLLSLVFLSFYTSSASADYACPSMVVNEIEWMYIWRYGGACFFLNVDNKKDYPEATNFCKSYGGTLAMPKNEDFNDNLQDQILYKHGIDKPVWIGLDDINEEGKYLWQDGTELEWSAFAGSTGGLGGGSEDCIAFHPREAKWHDYKCQNWQSFLDFSSAKRPFVCQVKGIPVNTTAAPPPEPTEVYKSAIEDSGLAEYTCPEDVLNKLDVYYVWKYEGDCYYFSLKKKYDFPNAIKYCERFGGTLAMPKTEDINFVLTNRMYYHFEIHRAVWIGLSDLKQEGKYLWMDGTEMEWNAFADGTGGLESGGEDCIALHPKTGEWHDYECEDGQNVFDLDDAKKPFFCQFKGVPVNSTATA